MAGGFRPIQDRSGHSYTGKVETYAVDATHATLLAVGDLVVETGNLEASTGLSEVDAVTASVAGTVKVANDKDMLLEAESSGGTFAVTDVGGNLDVVVTAATLTGGLANSNMTINTTGNASSTTAQVRIVGVKDSASLTFPAAAGTTLICRINESTNDAVGV
ncbi:MAG: hypothetical protein ACYSR9_11290 [Planctomycetota bacterium]|jgi:hypothetical protein